VTLQLAIRRLHAWCEVVFRECVLENAARRAFLRRWKRRLSHLAQYFSAYRIDHILGFCRIWEIPGDCGTGAPSAQHT
jgi:4-alpha-glucanotransferase